MGIDYTAPQAAKTNTGGEPDPWTDEWTQEVKTVGERRVTDLTVHRTEAIDQGELAGTKELRINMHLSEAPTDHELETAKAMLKQSLDWRWFHEDERRPLRDSQRYPHVPIQHR